MEDGRIAQARKNNDILSSESDFLELVGAHEAAVSVLDSEQVGTVSENASARKDNDASDGLLQEEGKTNSKNGKTVEPKAQLIQEKEQEKGAAFVRLDRLGFYMNLSFS